MTAEFMRERLFKAFSTSKSTGMGIGVYEAQQYIHELGGRIHFDSELGKGTRVTVVLPVLGRSGEVKSVMPEVASQDHE
jgi:signal transduction histidine kinase